MRYIAVISYETPHGTENRILPEAQTIHAVIESIVKHAKGNDSYDWCVQEVNACGIVQFTSTGHVSMENAFYLT